MLEILFSFPGLVGLLIFVLKRSPLPNREWLLTPFALFLSSLSLVVSYFFRYSVGIPYWSTFDTFISFFSYLDEQVIFLTNEDSQFLGAGVYSMSFLVVIIISLVMKQIIPDNLLQNPEGNDYIDFLGIELVFIETSTKKIYVGKLTQAPLSDSNPSALFSIIPIMSGFRSDYDEVIYTNLYREEDIQEDKLSKIEISLTLGSLVSIREFNMEAFHKFIQKGTTVVRFK